MCEPDALVREKLEGKDVRRPKAGDEQEALKGQPISTGEQAPLTVEGAEKLEKDEKEKLAKFFDETPRDREDTMKLGTSSRRGSLFRLSSSAQIHPSPQTES